MALSTIKLNSGQLGKANEEELSNLQKMSQRPAPATDPATAASIGANPDQAKMAGSSANKLSALRTSVQQSSEIGTAERRRGPATEFGGAGLPDKIKKLQEMQGLAGDMRNRVPQLMLQKAQAELQQKLSAAPQYGPSQLKLLGIDPSKQADAQKAIESVSAARKAADAAKIAADSEHTRGLPWEQIKELQQKAKAADEAVGSAMGGLRNLAGKDIDENSIAMAEKDRQEQLQQESIDAIKNQKLTMGSLDNETLSKIQPGLTLESLKSMAPKDASGKPIDISGMSWDEFSDAMLANANKDFNSAGAIKAKLAAPGIGPAERAALQQQLGAMGDVGIASEESKLNDIAQQAKDGDNIMVNGKPVQIDSLFQDAGAKADMASWAAETDPAKKSEIESKLAQQYGQGFVDYMNKNSAAIAQQSANMSEGAKRLGQIQSDNKSLNTFGGGLPPGISASDELMAKLVPGYGSFSTQSKSLPNEPLMQAIQSADSPESKAQMLANLEQIKDSPLLDKVRKMPMADLQRIDISSPTFAQDLQEADTKQAMIKSAGSVDELLSVIFGSAGADQLKELGSLPGGLSNLPPQFTEMLSHRDQFGSMGSLGYMKQILAGNTSDDPVRFEMATTKKLKELQAAMPQAMAAAYAKAGKVKEEADAAKQRAAQIKIDAENRSRQINEQYAKDKEAARIKKINDDRIAAEKARQAKQKDGGHGDGSGGGYSGGHSAGEGNAGKGVA